MLKSFKLQNNILTGQHALVRHERLIEKLVTLTARLITILNGVTKINSIPDIWLNRVWLRTGDKVSVWKMCILNVVSKLKHACVLCCVVRYEHNKVVGNALNIVNGQLLYQWPIFPGRIMHTNQIHKKAHNIDLLSYFEAVSWSIKECTCSWTAAFKMLMSPSMKLAGTKRTLFLCAFSTYSIKKRQKNQLEKKIIILLRSSSTCICGLHDFVPGFEATQLRNGSMEKLYLKKFSTELNHGNRSVQAKDLCHFFREVLL